MSENRFEFGKVKIEALPLPDDGKRATYYDTKAPRLALRVTSKGAKTFYVVKRVAAEVVWIKLGAFPDLTTENARKEAERILGSFAHGQNPAEARRASKIEPTFGDFFKEYGERHGNKKRSWNTDESIYSNHLKKPLASRKLSAVSRESISRILSDLERAGKSGGTINNVRALISSVFSKAIEWGYAASNPVVGIKTRAKVKRDRFLQSDEMPRFFKALAEETNTTLRDYIIMALLTGARRANLLAMRWREVNLDEAVWRIPVTKNGTRDPIAGSGDDPKGTEASRRR